MKIPKRFAEEMTDLFRSMSYEMIVRTAPEITPEDMYSVFIPDGMRDLARQARMFTGSYASMNDRAVFRPYNYDRSLFGFDTTLKIERTPDALPMYREVPKAFGTDNPGFARIYETMSYITEYRMEYTRHLNALCGLLAMNSLATLKFLLPQIEMLMRNHNGWREKADGWADEGRSNSVPRLPAEVIARLPGLRNAITTVALFAEATRGQLFEPQVKVEFGMNSIPSDAQLGQVQTVMFLGKAWSIH